MQALLLEWVLFSVSVMSSDNISEQMNAVSVFCNRIYHIKWCLCSPFEELIVQFCSFKQYHIKTVKTLQVIPFHATCKSTHDLSWWDRFSYFLVIQIHFTHSYISLLFFGYPQTFNSNLKSTLVSWNHHCPQYKCTNKTNTAEITIVHS